jgi:sugar phosphate isomerase/epimerase
MRLGGPVFGKVGEAGAWVAAHRALGYSAALAPDLAVYDAGWADFLEAAERADLMIAEVGAWSNTISADESERRKAIGFCCERLALAEKIGARVCVNIAGSRGKRWDGPHPDNLSSETFDLIVETVREIIDAVKPVRAVYALETMPWVLPDSPDSYLALIRAIDRKGFGVHLDPVNMINCPSRAYRTGDFIRECFEKLGPWIRSCHAKDIAFSQHLTLHLDEMRPGLGVLDYGVFLRELAQLGDVPILLEHLKTAEEYAAGAEYIREVARGVGVSFR